MTANEIQRIINRKGQAAQDIYNTWKEHQAHSLFYYAPDCFHDEDVMAIYSYNCTILFLKLILDNPDYYEKRCKIFKRSRERIRKDLETMKQLDYPEKYKDIDFGFYERVEIGNLPLE